MASWHLVDAGRIAEDHKYTFYKASAEIIAKVAVGETVKLIFGIESDDPEAPAAERMWVIVDSIDGKGGFTGRLDNVPGYIKDIALNDRISFRDVHIINTQHDDEDSIVDRFLSRCFVTNRVVKEGERIGYLYRRPR